VLLAGHFVKPFFATDRKRGKWFDPIGLASAPEKSHKPSIDGEREVSKSGQETLAMGLGLGDNQGPPNVRVQGIGWLYPTILPLAACERSLELATKRRLGQFFKASWSG
jgi:hypothetical protein